MDQVVVIKIGLKIDRVCCIHFAAFPIKLLAQLATRRISGEAINETLIVSKTCDGIMGGWVRDDSSELATRWRCDGNYIEPILIIKKELKAN